MQVQLNRHLILPLIAAESLLLSILHHRFNFWAWPWEKQAFIILIVAPVAAFLVERLQRPLTPRLHEIKRAHWLLFLLPALVVAVLTAWHFMTPPEVRHELDIDASLHNSSGSVQIQEIRAAYGNLVPLSTFKDVPGWTLQQGLLVAYEPGSAPIQYSFVGPINEQVRVTFLVSPQAGRAEVRLDGQQVLLGLAGPEGSQARARPTTQYLWGFLNFLIMPLTLAADICTMTLLLAALWIMQEVTQNQKVADAALLPHRFLSHAHALVIVLIVALALHAINFLSVPLVVSKDGPSYLQGAVYWIQHHNLDGVSSYRGLGTTLLFTPALALFGRNPWGVKLVLHALALGCVALSYRLGWQLGRRSWFAFSAALLTAFVPDLYAYSNYVLSEVPHVFSVMLFCTLLISALESLSPGWILGALLAGTFSILVRSESLVLFVLGLGFICLRMLWLLKTDASALPTRRIARLTAGSFVLALVIAAAPLAAWSAHNQRVYGFFGLSDYGGEALYDGWIYFGENSHIPITDEDSRAVRAIGAAYSSEVWHLPQAVPTGWTVYDALLAHGYDREQAFALLQQAALDSIRKDMSLTSKLLLVKLREGLEPSPFTLGTLPLPGEGYYVPARNAMYFDNEPILSSSLVHLQRLSNDAVGKLYERVFSVWFWLGSVLLFISLYRRPFFGWAPLLLLTASSIIVPTVIGMSNWRYVFSGLILLQYPLLAGIQSIGRFIPFYLRHI